MIYSSTIIGLFGNIWIWLIFKESKYLFFLLIASTLTFYSTIKRKGSSLRIIFLISIILLSAYQFKSTSVRSLTEITNEDIRVRDMRLREYPPVYLRLGEKTLWIPIAHWFEERPESIAFFRLMDNLSQAIDPNYYFFANHPREKIGLDNTEKYPYILLPVFLLGAYNFLNRKNLFHMTIGLIFPLIVISTIGQSNPLGPFILFPFITTATIKGMNSSLSFAKKNYPEKNKFIIVGFAVAYILVLIQVVSYQAS